MAQAAIPYLAVIFLALLYMVKICTTLCRKRCAGKEHFDLHGMQHVQQQLGMVPLPVLHIFCVVLFAFIMLHVQLVLVPTDCIPCGLPGEFCLAAQSQIKCGSDVHTEMVVVSNILFVFMAIYTISLMVLLRKAWVWQQERPDDELPWFIQGLTPMVADMHGYREENWSEEPAYELLWAMLTGTPDGDDDDEDDAIKRGAMKFSGVLGVLTGQEGGKALDAYDVETFNQKDEEEEEEEKEVVDIGPDRCWGLTWTEGRERTPPESGSFWTFTYMVWGIFICLDFPLQFFVTVFGAQAELALFSQALVIAGQCCLVCFFKPFASIGTNYFAIIAGFLEFLLATTSGFLALFVKYTSTELGKAYAHYVPTLEFWCNVWVGGIFAWCVGLVLFKIMAVIKETFFPEEEEEPERRNAFVPGLNSSAVTVDEDGKETAVTPLHKRNSCVLAPETLQSVMAHPPAPSAFPASPVNSRAMVGAGLADDDDGCGVNICGGVAAPTGPASDASRSEPGEPDGEGEPDAEAPLTLMRPLPEHSSPVRPAPVSRRSLVVPQESLLSSIAISGVPGTGCGEGICYQVEQLDTESIMPSVSSGSVRIEMDTENRARYVEQVGESYTEV